MKATTKADTAAARMAAMAAAATPPENGESASVGAGIGNASNPPRGEDIDGGDVEEIIHLDPNESITVVYRGAKEVKGKKAGEISRLHKFVFEDGVARGIWGTMQLDGMLAKCQSGDTLWIGYLGKSDLPGGNTLHNWKVVRTASAR